MTSIEFLLARLRIADPEDITIDAVKDQTDVKRAVRRLPADP